MRKSASFLIVLTAAVLLTANLSVGTAFGYPDVIRERVFVTYYGGGDPSQILTMSMGTVGSTGQMGQPTSNTTSTPRALQSVP